MKGILESELIGRIIELENALMEVQSSLITVRGVNTKHDSEITEICGKIRAVLEGGEYE